MCKTIFNFSDDYTHTTKCDGKFESNRFFLSDKTNFMCDPNFHQSLDVVITHVDSSVKEGNEKIILRSESEME